jgi:hypothetical protein
VQRPIWPSGPASRRSSASPCEARLPVRGPHAKGPPQAFISLPPPPGPPTGDTRRPPPLAPRPRRNPSAATFGFSPSSPELRKEVSIAPVPQDIESVLRRDRKTSPEFVGRAAASTGRSAATPPRPPPRPASRARALRVGAARASHRAPEP